MSAGERQAGPRPWLDHYPDGVDWHAPIPPLPLHSLLDQVRAQGSPLSADTLEPSDLILPPQDASMDEVREMLTDEGLIGA